MLRGKIIIALMGIYWLIFVQDAGRVPNVDRYLGSKPVQFITYMYLFFTPGQWCVLPRTYPKSNCMNRPYAGENPSWRTELHVTGGGIAVWLADTSTFPDKHAAVPFGNVLKTSSVKKSAWEGKGKKHTLLKLRTLFHLFNVERRRGYFPMGVGTDSFLATTYFWISWTL